MRFAKWLAFVAVVVPSIALAQPPAPTTGNQAATPDPASERAKLQAELLSALRRLNVPPPSTPQIAPAPKVKPALPVVGKGPDSVREGMNLFRDNDFEAAARVFQLIDPTVLTREDRAFVRYMLGCCLRRIGRVGEAEVIYREVANSGDDEFLASSAISQLALLRAEQELQAQLAQLRARAKSR